MVLFSRTVKPGWPEKERSTTLTLPSMIRLTSTNFKCASSCNGEVVSAGAVTAYHPSRNMFV